MPEPVTMTAFLLRRTSFRPGARRPDLRAGLMALGLAALASAFAETAPVAAPVGRTPAQLQDLVEQDCGSCHGLTRRGGLGVALTAAALAGKDETGLARVILDGISGTPMPPWRGLLNESEALWIVRYLKQTP